MLLKLLASEQVIKNYERQISSLLYEDYPNHIYRYKVSHPINQIKIYLNLKENL